MVDAGVAYVVKPGDGIFGFIFCLVRGILFFTRVERETIENSFLSMHSLAFTPVK